MVALPPGGHWLAGGGSPAGGRDRSLLNVVQDLRGEGVVVETVLPVQPPGPRQSPSALVRRLKWVFSQEGVPQELVWIAEVESSFDQAATSRSGAAGLFQLMPDTARRFGLEVSGRRDERRHPVRSAVAAARYLRDLHRRFGSWLLAVAAYHAGEGRVEWAVDGAGCGPGACEMVQARLPEATREYVELVFNIVEAEEGVGPDRIPAPGDILPAQPALRP